MNKDLYSILGVSKSATAEEIKGAFRRLAKQYHPDQHPGDKEAEAKFKEISMAYEVLGDEKKRAQYDRFGSADNMGGGGFGGFEGFDFSQAFSGFGDLFENLFDGGLGDLFGGGRRRQRENRGADIHLQLNLTFREAALGVTKTINFSRFEKCRDCNGTGARDATAFSTCNYCNGSGATRTTRRTAFGMAQEVTPCSACNATGKLIREKCGSCSGKGAQKKNVEYELNVPAGIANGQILNIAGEGDSAKGVDGLSGALMVTVRVTPHPLLVRHDFDLHLELPISFTQAILGDRVVIPTIDGTTTIKIDANTQTGTVQKLKGKGIKRLRNVGHGDLLVKIVVEIPNRIDKKTAQLLATIDQNVNPKEYAKRTAYLDKLRKL